MTRLSGLIHNEDLFAFIHTRDQLWLTSCSGIMDHSALASVWLQGGSGVWGQVSPLKGGSLIDVDIPIISSDTIGQSAKLGLVLGMNLFGVKCLVPLAQPVWPQL